VPSEKPKSVTEKDVIVLLLPDDVKSAGEITVTVATRDGMASPAATLRVSDVAIVTTSGPVRNIQCCRSSK
jgi:hypothetical protein